MTEMIVLIVVSFLTSFKCVLDPSWLNKLISLCGFAIIFPIALVKVSAFYDYSVSLWHIIFIVVISGLSLMTIFCGVYERIQKFNTSKIED